ncbi:oxidoreductase [Azorhizobium oxalatiphilum]|uniref:D-lactate dehydrogenase (cytochrome) n=1 Tax=Azorhizobium oxalatiphilum TaxID=980631 RepID=A0A917C794_9HYPH|nr:FAD-linked oxidase C-terminal domain-containing protein [Azorhizobium oxalatiphilum]GGF75648.1 oxidoreductase [Azorhizobium oxalatiphilum]
MLGAAAKKDFANGETLSTALGELSAKLGQKVVMSRAVREQHANITTFLPNEPADAVIMATCVEDVQTTVRICAAHNVPIIPWGAGTSLEGHVNAPYGGVCIDLSGMNRILKINTEDLDCVIEPGVTRKRLNEELRDQGLFFPIDPGADASLGGMASTRASGTNAVRYGTMKDNVIALKVVMPNGELITTSRRARKSSAGYDLTRLFIGAEGTLGIIVEITLKLYGIPESIVAGVCSFPTIADACNTVIQTIQCGIPVARIELLDEVQVRASNAYAKLTLPETPHLFLEFHGSETGAAEQAEMFAALAADNGGGPFASAEKPEDRTKLWQARHDAYWSVLPLRPGAKAVATDVCVPISRLAECVEATKTDIIEMGLIAPIVGHVGDGNFHTTLMVDVTDHSDVAKAEIFMKRLVERALAMEGTCTGEHGVGEGKKKYLYAEHGAGTLDAMHAIKTAFDPQNIMNPGKILPG